MLGLCGLALTFAGFDGSLLFLALPSISTDFHARIGDLSNLGSVVALGTLGAVPLAAMADRSGRRRLLIWGTGAFSLADLASAAAPSLPALASVRVVAGCFEALVGALGAVMVIEAMPTSSRAGGVAIVTLAAGLGSGLTLVGYPLLGERWRLLYALGGLGVPAALVLARWLPESRLWKATAPSPPASRRLWRAPWRRRLVLLGAVGALGAIGYEPGGLFVALFGSQQLRLPPAAISAVIFVSGVLAAPGYLAGGWLGDRFGRRLPGTGLALASASAAALTFVWGARGYEVGNLVWGLFAGAAAPVLIAWLAELFPTRARVTAEAITTVAGGLGGIVGLQLVGRLVGGLGLGPSLVTLTAGPVLGACLLLFLPETRGAALDE